MVSFLPWLGVTMPGIVYVTALFFLILAYAGKPDLDFGDNIKPYAPYIAILVLFFSYLVGLAAHFLTQRLWVLCFHHEEVYSAAKQLSMHSNVPKEILTSLGESYDTLVTLRHLIISFFCLGVTLYVWLCEDRPIRVAVSLPVACWLLSLFFYYAYSVERGAYVPLVDTITARFGP